MGKSKIETELSEEQLQDFCNRLADTPKLTLKKLQSMAAEIGIEVSLMGAKSFRDGAFAEHIEKMRRAKELALQLKEVGNADAAGSIADAGALVRIVHDGQTIGIGLSNYPASDLELIRGLSRLEVAARLGDAHYPEVIHRDNMLLDAAI